MEHDDQNPADKPHPGPDVTITYNGEPKEIHRGNYPLAELRQKLHVPDNEILAQFIDGAFKDLTEGRIVIKGGEVFASHRPQGGAS